METALKTCYHTVVMSIKENAEKIKGFVDFSAQMDRNSFIFGLLVVISASSFALGRLSGLETAAKEVEVEFPSNTLASSYVGVFATTSAPQLPSKTSGKYLASKNGTK